MTTRFVSATSSLGERELAATTAGRAADVVLAGALGLRLRPSSAGRSPATGLGPTVKSLGQGSAEAGSSCVRLSPRDGRVKAAITLPPGGALLAGSGPLEGFGISRFFELPWVRLQAPADSRAAYLRIPTDGSPVPWTLWVDSRRELRLCGP